VSPTPERVRDHAAAFLTAALAALVADAVLQLALDAVAVSAYSGGAPWWITAHLPERGRWAALAALLWWLSPSVVSRDGGAREARADRGHEVPVVAVRGADVTVRDAAEAWRQTGVAVIAVPLLWVIATWLVSAVRFTLLGSWSTDGLVFLSSGYYRGLLVDYAPWLMAGLTVLGIRRHLA
jgi:hypothetical protein